MRDSAVMGAAEPDSGHDLGQCERRQRHQNRRADGRGDDGLKEDADGDDHEAEFEEEAEGSGPGCLRPSSGDDVARDGDDQHQEQRIRRA